MRWRNLFLALLFTCFWLLQLSAEDQASVWAEIGVANGNLILRSGPPSGPFYLKGDRIGIIPKGERFTVTGRERVETLFETQEWLHVERTPGRPNDPTQGWVYNGLTEANKPYVVGPDSGLRPAWEQP